MPFKDLLKLTDFVTVPVAFLVLFAIHPPTLVGLGLIVLGVMVWTFLEYWMHRALHVGRLRPFHMKHHQHPKDLIGGTLWSSLIVLAMVGLAWLAPVVAPFVQGIFLGYFWYVSLHWFMHHEDHGLSHWEFFRRLEANHEAHHKGRPRLFGVSTNIWDHVFGTA